MVQTLTQKKQSLAKNSKKGFTLVELVIVIAILAILAAIAIPTVSGLISKANAAADDSNRQAIETMLKLYATDVETTQNATTGKVDNGQTLTAICAKYSVDISSLDVKVNGKAFDWYSTNNTLKYENSSTGGVALSSGGATMTVTVNLTTGEVVIAAP